MKQCQNIVLHFMSSICVFDEKTNIIPGNPEEFLPVELYQVEGKPFFFYLDS